MPAVLDTAGECNLDVHDPCTICGGWTSKQWGKLRSLVDARARASQRGRQHWTAAFPQLEAWIMSRPALLASSSGPASEISSLVSGDNFNDSLLVSMSSPLVQQDFGGTKWGQYEVGYRGTATTAPSTPLRHTVRHPPLTAGPSTIEPIVAPLGAQDTPSVIQGARPVVSTEQTMQSTQRYGTLPYVSGPRIGHPCRLRHPCRMLRIGHPCRLRHPCHMLPCLLCQQGLLSQWVIMVRAISSLLCLFLIG